MEIPLRWNWFWLCFALCGGLTLLALEARAETVWDDPGIAPYSGTLTEAVLALADCGAPYAAVAQLAWRAERGACEDGEVHDGDQFDLMLSAHDCLRDVVARIIVPGWNGKTRKTLECHDGAGNWLIIPEACNNASYAYRPPPIGLPPGEVGIPIPGYPVAGLWPVAEIAGAGGEFGGAIGAFTGFAFPIAAPLAGTAVAPSAENAGTATAGAPIAVVGATPVSTVPATPAGASAAPANTGSPITPISSPGVPLSGAGPSSASQPTPTQLSIPTLTPTLNMTPIPISVPEPSSLLLLLTAITPLAVLLVRARTKA